MTDFLTVTELAGDEVSQEQIQRICNRYYWAGEYCRGKDVLEAACGTGQGLGYLEKISKSVQAGDYSGKILDIAQSHYGDRILLTQFDAQDMPFSAQSFDVVILFEAIYYLPQADRFVDECRRVLRPGGVVLIATANKDLFDFNPSPFSHTYYGVRELHELFVSKGFEVECFGDTPVSSVSWRQKLLRPVKRIAVELGLIPKTVDGKKWLKKFVFGKLTQMPAEISANTCEYVRPTALSNKPDTEHKVIYCAASLTR